MELWDSFAQELAPDIGPLAACEAMGVSRATFYRERKPKGLSGPRPTAKLALTPRDLAALSPLLTQHINRYGRFELDMAARLLLDAVA